MPQHCRDYTTVNIPLVLADKIKAALPKGGYANVPDFVRDAVRRRIEQVKEAA